MTSPITPESRAKDFANWMSHHILGGMAAKDETCGACIAHAASVIRDAENAALERAAAWFEDQTAATKKLIATMGPSEFTSSTFKILEAVPADIRSLKTKET